MLDGTSDDEPRGLARLAVLLELDAEQSAWVHRASTAAGLDYVSFLTKVIEEARARAGGEASAPAQLGTESRATAGTPGRAGA